MDDQHNRCSYVCGVHLQRCILKKFHKENDCLCVADRYVQLEAENAQLKANIEKANEELCDFMGAIDKLKAALEGIVKIRFLLGNDPKLNPAYEMGDIAQQALKEASCESTSQSR